VIQNALRKAFSPEFLNRVDDMIMFKSLYIVKTFTLIIDLELKKLYGRINDLGYHIELTEKAKDFIVEKGYDEKFGARPLKRAIQKYIEDPLAEEIIKSSLHEGDKIIVEGNGEKPSEASTVKVHYHGTLIDGTVFDSSYERGTPATFGVTQVIKGWTEALQLMPVGSKYKLYIPENLAYGATPHPNGPIKPHMTLIFDVELLEIL
jgi:hypothetical protein